MVHGAVSRFDWLSTENSVTAASDTTGERFVSHRIGMHQLLGEVDERGIDGFTRRQPSCRPLSSEISATNPQVTPA